jgi:predicted ATPase/DNA-binding SARP family transcriptional activator
MFDEEDSTMPRLALFLLGPPRIECNGTPLHLDRRKAVALAAYLAVTGQRHRRETLAALFWPEQDQARAHANLRRTLAAVKEAVGDECLAVDRGHIGFCQENVYVDVGEFGRLVASSQAHSHASERLCPACLESLGRAVALYRGDFLAGFTLRDCPDFDDWQSVQSQHLHAQLSKALSMLANGHAARAEWETAIGYARRWLAVDPLRESAHRCMMRLHAWTGRLAAAIEQYEACAQVLQQELDILPSDETSQLRQAIEENRCPPPPSPPVPRSSLPSQPTPFVGRERELSQIAQLLAGPNCRLLALVGPGGIGKTRLALEAAARQAQLFAHGVHFVPLVSVGAPRLMPAAIAGALGFTFEVRSEDAVAGTGEHEGQVHKKQLLSYLRDKEMLLLLDNFEHLVAGAGLLTELLSAAPKLRLLVTSRERLHLRAERLVEVRGMAYPPPEKPDALARRGDFGAVKLFLTSARRSNPDLALAKAEQAAIVRTCRLLDGMPLGIELSAAWARTLSCTEIAQEVERALTGDNLDFLAAPIRDAPERHRSLRAVFEHSWGLLSPQEQSALSALAVFRGGFGRRAAEQVAGASLTTLSRLVDKSLVQARVSDPRTQGTRYDMHELLTKYAGEKLAERAQVQDRHARYYAAFLQQRGQSLQGKGQRQALEEIERELDNVRAAWQWAISHGGREVIEQSLDSLYTFYLLRGTLAEGRNAFQCAARMLAGDDLTQVQDALAARVAARLGRFLHLTYRLSEAHALYERSLAVFNRLGIHKERAFVLIHMAGIAHWERRSEEARALYHESLSIARETGDRDLEAGALGGLATVAYDLYESDEADALYRQVLAIRQDMGAPLGISSALIGASIGAARLGRREQASQLVAESLAIREEMGDRRGIASCYYQLAVHAWAEHNYDQAIAYYERCVEVSRDLGDLPGTIGALSRLKDVLARLGRLERAWQVREQLMDLAQQLDEPRWMAFALQGLGQTAHERGDYTRARQLYGQSLAIGRETTHQRIISYSLRGMGDAAYADDQHAEAKALYQESLANCRGRENQDLVPIIHLGLGRAACALGEYAEAKASVWQALNKALEWDSASLAFEALSEVALLYAKAGQPERAVEVLTLVLCHSRAWFQTRERATRFLDELVAELPEETAAAAQALGKEASFETTCRAALAFLADRPG